MDAIRTYKNEKEVEANIKCTYGEHRWGKTQYYRFHGPVLEKPLENVPKLNGLPYEITSKVIKTAAECSEVIILFIYFSYLFFVLGSSY